MARELAIGSVDGEDGDGCEEDVFLVRRSIVRCAPREMLTMGEFGTISSVLSACSEMLSSPLR